jgi:hypothetical protein
MPLILIGLVNFWGVFIPMEKVADRLNYSSSMFLTTTAFIYVTTNYVPKLTFLTRIGAWQQVRKHSSSTLES